MQSARAEAAIETRQEARESYLHELREVIDIDLKIETLLIELDILAGEYQKRARKVEDHSFDASTRGIRPSRGEFIRDLEDYLSSRMAKFIPALTSDTRATSLSGKHTRALLSAERSLKSASKPMNGKENG